MALRTSRLQQFRAALIAALMLCMLVLANAPFVWCPRMERVGHGCCPPKARSQTPSNGAAQSHDERAPALVAAKCCETRELHAPGELKEPEAPQLKIVATAPRIHFVVASLSHSFARQRPPRSRAAHIGKPIRAGPKQARERRAKLQVYLL